MFFLSYLEIKFILFFKKNDKFALFYKNNDKKKFKIIKLEIDEKLSKKNLNLIHKFKIIKIYYSYQNINYKIIIKNNSELNNFKNFMYREDFKVKKSNILSAYYLDSDITDNIKFYEGPNSDFYKNLNINLELKDIIINYKKDKQIQIIDSNGDNINIKNILSY